jgi:hypothetical protein
MPLVEPRLERLPYYVALRLVDRPQERSSPDRPIRQRTDQILDAIEWKLDRSRGDRHLDEAGGANQTLEHVVVRVLEERRAGWDLARRRNLGIRDRAEQRREERRPFWGLPRRQGHAPARDQDSRELSSRQLRLTDVLNDDVPKGQSSHCAAIFGSSLLVPATSLTRAPAWSTEIGFIRKGGKASRGLTPL